MKLLKLTLENFKGFKEKEIVFNGSNTNIYAANGVGKTTIFDAYCWLLTGKDSKGRTDIEFRVIDPDSAEVVHDIQTSVEAELLISDKPIKVKRMQREKWVKKNGSIEKELTGTTFDYAIDGVPVPKQKDFDAWIEANIGANILRLTSDPAYFPNMDWKMQRQLLLDVCGDISDEDVIASNKELAELSKALDGKSVDNFKAIQAAKQKEIASSINDIPIRIDEATKSLMGLEDIESVIKSSQDLVDSHQTAVDKLNQERAGIVSGAGVENMKLEIDKYKLQLNQVNEAHKAKRKDAVSSIDSEIQVIKDSVAGSDQTISKLRYQYTANIQWISSYVDTMDELRESWSKVNADTFDESNFVCPTCGAKLPEDKAASLKVEFNTKRASKLEEIQNKGKSLKEKVEALKKANEGLLLDINKYSVADEKARNEIARLNTKKEETLRNFPTVENQQDYILITQKIDEINRNISLAKENVSKALEEMDEKISAAKEPLDKFRQKLASAQTEQKTRERIEQLKAEKEELKEANGDVMKWIRLCELFVTTKVEMLTDRVNKKFPGLTFKLFHQQVNGGIQETCELRMHGIPYRNLSNAQKAYAGMIVVQTLSSHFDANNPVFIDNREGVTKIPDTESQVISLFVSPEDQELRVENK